MAESKQGILHHITQSTPSVFVIALVLGLISLGIAAVYTNWLVLLIALVVAFVFFLWVSNRHRKVSTMEYAIEAVAAFFTMIIVIAGGNVILGLTAVVPHWAGVSLLLLFAGLIGELLAWGIICMGFKIKK